MKKIFVVDDDESIDEVVSQMLEIEGFDVKSFLRGRDLIEEVKKSMPDLILLDYFIPGENAEDTVRSVKSYADNSLHIVLMSASMQAANHAKSMQVSEFLSKPFQREVLIDAVRRNLD